MRPRITVSHRPDGAFEIAVNEAGRDLLVRELQSLSTTSDHFHFQDDEGAEVTLAATPYRADDRVLSNGKVLFRPDEWDAEFYPHVVRVEGQE